MVSLLFHLLIVLCILLPLSLSTAQKKFSAEEKTMYRAGYDDAWSWGNAFVVKTNFEQFYYPHAKELLDAEISLASGKPAKELVKSLGGLPGVKGAVILFTGESEAAQWPDSLVQFDVLAGQLFNTERGVSKKDFVAPMMHRTLGGKVAPQRVLTGDKYQHLDLLARFVYGPDDSHAASIICLVLDPQWLIAQIPAVMDSLYRENAQLLFAAASPLNKLWEQSLGVIAGKDTLWWVGRKDVKIRNEQFLWPYENIRVPSYVHTLEQK